MYYYVIVLCKGPMISKLMFYIMFAVTIKSAGEKSTRHLLKNMKKSGGLRSAWGLQKILLAFVLATLSIVLLYPVAWLIVLPLCFWLKCGYHSQRHSQASIPNLAALAKWQASNATLTWCLAVSIPSRTVVLKSSCLPCGRKEENSGTLLHKLR